MSIVFNHLLQRKVLCNQSAVDKNGRHGNEITCCAGLMSIYSKFIGENKLFFGIENHLNDPKSRIDILFDTRRSGSV